MTLAFFWRSWGHIPYIKAYLRLPTTTIGNEPMTLHLHKHFVSNKEYRHRCSADPSRRKKISVHSYLYKDLFGAFV